MIATKLNDINLIQFLLKYHHCADLNQTDKEGNTCLMYSINNDLKEVALFLISKDDIDVNKCNDSNGISPLIAAVKRNSIDICSALADRDDTNAFLKDTRGILKKYFFLSFCIFDSGYDQFI